MNKSDKVLQIKAIDQNTQLETMYNVGPIEYSGKKKNNTTILSDNNLNFEPSYVEGGGPGNYGDILFKPGDDIMFCSHHRELDKQGEVSIKVVDGKDNVVDLDLNTKSLTFQKKSKASQEDEEFNIEVNTGSDKAKGYLKVRARAIDLRCQDHGGIALLPKGRDSKGNMNKIKFEHGGGDGLEFGTFNAEKTSIFTDEYRFNKDGIWKGSTRIKVQTPSTLSGQPNKKYDAADNTTHNTYKKNELGQTTSGFLPGDDFYDFIPENDVSTTTDAIIKTSYALNSFDGITTTISGSGNLKISGVDLYEYPNAPKQFEGKKTLKETETALGTKLTDPKNPSASSAGLTRTNAPKITIYSDTEVAVESEGDVVLTSSDTIKQEAPEIRLNALNPDKTGGSINFGATSKLVFLAEKLTKSGNVEKAGEVLISIAKYNNLTKDAYWDTNKKKFIYVEDKLFLDAGGKSPYNPKSHSAGVPVYLQGQSTPVPAEVTMFVIHNVDGGAKEVYKVGTKGSEAVLSKSNTLIANISAEGVYTRTSKKDTVNNPDLEVVPIGTSVESLTLVRANDFFIDSNNSCNLSDLIKLVNWTKTNNFGPWQV